MDELNSGVGLAGELLGPSRPGEGGAAHIDLAAQLQARCSGYVSQAVVQLAIRLLAVLARAADFLTRWLTTYF